MPSPGNDFGLLIQDNIGSAETDDLRHQPNENEVRKKTICSEKTEDPGEELTQ